MKTFSTEYTAKNLTKHAGLVNLGKFAEKIGLPGILEKRLTIKRGATADYEISEIVMMLMMGVLAPEGYYAHLKKNTLGLVIDYQERLQPHMYGNQQLLENDDTY